VVQALLDRTSRLLTHPLAVALYRQDRSSLPFERFLVNLLQGDDGEKCLVLPWQVSLSTAILVEAAKHALALATQETVQKRSQPTRRSASGLASFGSWDGIRNPEEALDRLIPFFPGWQRQTTLLEAGTRSVLLPCIEQMVQQHSDTLQQQLTLMRQAVEGALLHESSLTASLRTDGAITIDSLTWMISDFIMVLTSTSSVK
jgi:hypothetical protein